MTEPVYLRHQNGTLYALVPSPGVMGDTTALADRIAGDRGAPVLGLNRVPSMSSPGPGTNYNLFMTGFANDPDNTTQMQSLLAATGDPSASMTHGGALSARLSHHIYNERVQMFEVAQSRDVVEASKRADRDLDVVLLWMRRDPEFASLMRELAVELNVNPSGDETMVRRMLMAANEAERRIMLSYQEQLEVIGLTVLAVGGIADPTPATDAIGAAGSAHLGDRYGSEYYWDIPWFVLGWIPYVGDLGKSRLLVKLRDRLHRLHQIQRNGLKAVRRRLPTLGVLQKGGGRTAAAAQRFGSVTVDEVAKAIRELESQWGVHFGQSFIFVKGAEGRKGVADYVDLIRSDAGDLPLPWIVGDTLADGHHMAVAMQITGSWTPELLQMTKDMTNAARQSGQLDGWRFTKTTLDKVAIYGNSLSNYIRNVR